METRAEHIRSRAVTDLTRVWVRFDDDLANDAYASTSNENGVKQGEGRGRGEESEQRQQRQQ